MNDQQINTLRHIQRQCAELAKQINDLRQTGQAVYFLAEAEHNLRRAADMCVAADDQITYQYIEETS